MTDPRGIVPLKAGSKTFKLQLPINSICEMEADFSEDRGVEMDCRMIGVQLESASFRSIRRVIFHALAEHWPEKPEKLTLDRAGEIMQAAGMAESAKAIGELWRETFPQGEEEDGDQEGGQEEAGNEPPNRKARRAAAAKKPKK